MTLFSPTQPFVYSLFRYYHQPWAALDYSFTSGHWPGEAAGCLYLERGVGVDAQGCFKCLLWVADLSQLVDYQLVVNASRCVFGIDEDNVHLRGRGEKVDDVSVENEHELLLSVEWHGWTASVS